MCTVPEGPLISFCSFFLRFWFVAVCFVPREMEVAAHHPALASCYSALLFSGIAKSLLAMSSSSQPPFAAHSSLPFAGSQASHRPRLTHVCRHSRFTHARCSCDKPTWISCGKPRAQRRGELCQSYVVRVVCFPPSCVNIWLFSTPSYVCLLVYTL